MNFGAWLDWTPELLDGLKVSGQLTAAVVVLGTLMALGLALMRDSRLRAVRILSLVVMEVGRGFPALIGLYLVYYGLPSTGLALGSFAAATAALAFAFAAYTCDVIHAGIQAVPRGQIEASRALGIGRATEFRKIVLPQATRIILPPMLTWAVLYFQTTSIAFTVAVPEAMTRASTIAAGNFEYLGVYAQVGLLYAIFCIPTSFLVQHLERRRFDGMQSLGS